MILPMQNLDALLNDRLSARLKAVCVAFVLALAAISSFSGAGDRLPLDTHDVMVALTSQEMMQRDDYLVPYINAEPRLKKPPMNYWMVKGVDFLHDNNSQVTPWEARMPSVIAGVVLTGATIALGVVWVGWDVALLGALMLICCRGFVSYSHSSRPEMVYAAFCGVAMTLLAISDRWEKSDTTRGRARWCAYAAWLAMGLASLTKGPQLPLAIVVGYSVGLWATGERHRILRTLRPFVGFILMAAVALPWVVAVRQAVSEATLIWQGEVTARTGRGNDPLYRYFYPYYLYSPAVLFLPWVVLLPLMWAAPWLERVRRASLPVQEEASSDDNTHGVRKLWWWVVCTALILSVVWGRREYYMLPMLAPMMLLSAYGLLWLGQFLKQKSLENIWLIFGAVMSLFAGAMVAYFYFAGARDHRPSLAMLIVAIVIAIAAPLSTFLLMLDFKLSKLFSFKPSISPMADRRLDVMTWCAIAAAWTLCMSITSTAGANWGVNRYYRDEFARAISSDMDPKIPLFGWKEQWYIEAYRTARVIPVLDDIDELTAQVTDNRTIYVLLRPKKRPIKLPAQFQSTSLRRLDFESNDEDGGNDPLELLKIELAAPASQPQSETMPAM